ncbi:biotin-dependent carboxyltransferase family protein [Nocardioides coralli]|uniref:5-oxoprolinase subunit C family protein n=1 Tax=Nocardioides coralli TaxID=2872154 RepID=UPI001CA42F51|nr:biotin-dependent carboxyltransferase family protein [Nocardioides coralli]QZY29212.1 biotin-dependent carboxyltransferase family protein [Nocardioides coralli]
MSRHLLVEEPGPLTTVQDEGRPGLAGIGVGRSGACDRASYRLANRLVGNRDGAAALEVTFGGLVLRAEADLEVVTTGARCPGAPHNAPTVLRAGEVLRLGVPETGLRTYLAVRGGVDVPPVLGSRSTDVLGHLGPAALTAGDRLRVGDARAAAPAVDVAAVAEPTGGALEVRVVPGPRRDWFAPDAWARLTSGSYGVGAESNRVGVRLEGEALRREREGELPSEGMVRGALQVPPSGQPVLFLADHPVTGGYPVIGYVVDEDVDRCSQLRPGQEVRLRERRT